MGIGIIWSGWYFGVIPVSTLTRFLFFAAAPLAALMIPWSLIQLIEQYEVLCRKQWIQPYTPLKKIDHTYTPFVSIHVPVHAEPPHIVLETLKYISKIAYKNFEVIVIDNNTKEEHLWKPIEKFCKKMGSPFRFFHVTEIKGAKAGALNIALSHTDKRAEFITIIDSDYHTQPDFLKKLIGYFKNPKIGFVQTPHDYRDWHQNPFLRMCYWEYKLFFHTTMRTLSERGAGLTVGTMCIIRKKALEVAGGWAHWCVTEDSELAIRIHAAGYDSLYITTSFGQGLIPTNFSDYKRQRFRWTAGPIQELKYHIGMLLPKFKSSEEKLTLLQRVHHLHHGIDRAHVGATYALLPVMIALILSMVYHQEVVHVPFELWLTATVLLAGNLALTIAIYRIILNASIKDTIGALIASKSLTHIIALASFSTLLTSDIEWVRTNKFNTITGFMIALKSTSSEIFLSVSLFALSIGAFAFLPKTGLLLMLLIGIIYKAIDYLFAPLVSFIAYISSRENTKYGTPNYDVP